jgi:hypothetical protein
MKTTNTETAAQTPCVNLVKDTRSNATSRCIFNFKYSRHCLKEILFLHYSRESCSRSNGIASEFKSHKDVMKMDKAFYPRDAIANHHIRMRVANLLKNVSDVAPTCFVHKHFSVSLTNAIADKCHSLTLWYALAKEKQCKDTLHVETQ